MTTRPLRECIRCHRVRPHCAKGLCITCYHNARKGPYKPAGNRGLTRRPQDVAERLEDYRILRRERGLTVEAAAAALGVNPRTGWRYETRLKTLVAA